MDFSIEQVKLLKDALEKGIISRSYPFFQEEKEIIIETQFEIERLKGGSKSKTEIEAIINKLFADELDIV